MERNRLETERADNEENSKRLEKVAEQEKTMTIACELNEAVGDKFMQEAEQSVKLFVKTTEKNQLPRNRV